MRRAIAFLAACGLASLRAGAEAEEAPGAKIPARPDVVFVIADDLGWADVGYHGSPIATPHIDRLAREGVRLERHYAAPTCTPTRVGLLSGRYPSRFGVLAPAYGRIFEDGTVTLASALREAGYETALSGKWHMGSPPEFGPRRYGFDRSYGYFHGQIDPYTHLYKTGERSWHRDDRLVEETGHATDLITAEAVRILEAPRARPLLLWVSYGVPHHPLNEPERWTSAYGGKFDEPSRRWYAASVTHMDDGIGRILDAIERTGRRSRTLVVFTSDNGAQRSWHSATEYGGAYAARAHRALGDNRPWRGWKGEPYEGGIRVPAVAWWPGVLEPRAVEAPIHVVDWMPTICCLARAAPSSSAGTAAGAWDGRDIWPLLAGEAPGEERTLYWKTPDASAVLRGDWKLIAWRRESRTELYDLGSDPREERDLAAAEPARAAELRRLLDEAASGDRGR